MKLLFVNIIQKCCLVESEVNKNEQVINKKNQIDIHLKKSDAQNHHSLVNAENNIQNQNKKETLQNKKPKNLKIRIEKDNLPNCIKIEDKKEFKNNYNKIIDKSRSSNSKGSNIAQKNDSYLMNFDNNLSSSNEMDSQLSVAKHIDKEGLKNHPRIELTIIEGIDKTQNNTKFLINNSGLVGSKRIKMDAYTYFGLGIITVFINQANLSDVDFILPPQAGLSQRHFYIRYDQELRKYFIKDMNSVGGTFLKIDPQLVS